MSPRRKATTPGARPVAGEPDPPRHILLGVSGSIACYKAADVASRLAQAGHRLTTLMTAHARAFIAPLTFEALTQGPVITEAFEPHAGHRPVHTDLADHADLFLICPATANIIAKLAAGIADDVLTSTALAVEAPILVVPAMNDRMFRNRIVQRNLETLREMGFQIVGPGRGRLACGTYGEGRLEEPDRIVEAVLARLRAP